MKMLPRRRLMESLRTLPLLAAVVVCAAPLLADDFGGAAKVLVMTGRVSIMRDSYEIAVNVGTVVQPKQLIVTGSDGYAKFELADGSTFEVFQNAKVIFRPTIGLLDLLDVWIGHVKVYIEHKNGPNYNRVTTQTAVISVRGTVFDVAVEDEDNTTLVSVDEGVVGVRHALLPGNEVQLLAGQSLRVYKDQPLAKNIDKGPGIRMALRAAAQAAYEALARRGTGAAGAPTGGGTTSTGGTTQGDQSKGGTTNGGKGGSGTSGGAPPPPPPAPPNP